MWAAVFARVYSKGRYFLLSLAVFFVGVSIVLLLPNQALIAQIFMLETASLFEKTSFLASLYGSIGTNFTLFSAGYTLLLLFLFAVNTTLYIFYIRRAQTLTRNTKSAQVGSMAGLVSGVLGIGCAACGSVILTGLAASIGATSLLLLLPLHGGEFALLGIVLLAWTITYLVKKINDPLVCLLDT